jgi:hypothetical protein
MKKLTKAEIGKFADLVVAGNRRAIEVNVSLQDCIRAILVENDSAKIEKLHDRMVDRIKEVIQSSV